MFTAKKTALPEKERAKSAIVYAFLNFLCRLYFGLTFPEEVTKIFYSIRSSKLSDTEPTNMSWRRHIINKGLWIFSICKDAGKEICFRVDVLLVKDLTYVPHTCLLHEFF
jgi:hypothetical protein